MLILFRLARHANLLTRIRNGCTAKYADLFIFETSKLSYNPARH
jgi:hypothetical protein